MNSSSRFLSVVLLGLAAGSVALAEEDRVGIPYNFVNKSMLLLKSQKIDGVDCVPFYLKATKDGPLDPAKARFRIRTWDGEEQALQVMPLASVPAKQLTDLEKKMIEAGFTHRMWIPKGEKRFLDGSILHSLPKGSIDMRQELEVSGSLKLGKDD